MVSHVQKRDGRIVAFEPEKIENAIAKAIAAVKGKDGALAKKLARDATEIVRKRFTGRIPHVEEIQDIVEETLVRNGYAEVAKAYILYRRQRAEQREFKTFLGVIDDLKMGVNAIKVLQRRYLKKDEKGNVIERPSQLFRRVARVVAASDRKYGWDAKKSEEEFYSVMASREFVPNSPTLMNAGTPLGQLSACFVIPVPDSLEGIFDAVKMQALIQQSGGGTGFSFSRLRPKGDVVKSTMGVASGPVSFMKIFDMSTEQIKQGGRRRGANMGILRVDHPDILEFITMKADMKAFPNFNISVAVTDEFMRAVVRDSEYELVNPRTNGVVKRLRARAVFDLICTSAWKTGDPGLVFIDEINRRHPLREWAEIEATNPCGEQPLLPYESCNLGSIDLSKLVRKNGELDWERLRSLVHTGIHFLDNVIDVNRYPHPEIARITRLNRKVGLGVMGYADMLVRMGIPYDSKEALRTGERVMAFIEREGRKYDEELGKKKGSFPNFAHSTWRRKHKAMRNACLFTIAPTGTISIIAGCSSGIEPLFAVSFVRDVMEGTKLIETNSHFEAVARARGFYSRELMLKIAKTGSVQGMREVPKDVQRVFVTTFDIEPKWHVLTQAAFQKHVDNAVSKTVNLPHDATPKDIHDIYMLAWKTKCKGITVYRYGSKPEQVLYIGGIEEEKLKEKEFVVADSEFAGDCIGPVCRV